MAIGALPARPNPFQVVFHAEFRQISILLYSDEDDKCGHDLLFLNRLIKRRR